MANELLDFVMSLVRDPEAAARYAADPAGAIADAHLTDVTSVDVNNLIPMVSDSLSMAAPTVDAGHLAGGLDGVDSNVWTSGAATAAFDSFAPHVPETAIHDLPGVIDTPMVHDLEIVHSVPAVDDFSQFNDLAAAPVDALGVDDPAGWEHDVISADHVLQQEIDDNPDGDAGFDLF